MPATTKESLMKRWVDQYRAQGYQPLPSDPRPESDGGRKKPLISFAQYWETLIPGDPFAKFNYDCNAQVMCGCHWRLLVIDLDGPEAEAQWKELTCTSARRTPKTWEVRSGSGGRHLWFTIPEGISMMPSGRIWSVWDTNARDWKKHTAIEILADRKLAMAPPSKHPRTGRIYRWIKGHSPYESANPSLCPPWLSDMPLLKPPSSSMSTYSAASPPTSRRSSTTANATAQQVLDAIPDKRGLAISWGLRTASERVNDSGWLACHAVGREDRTPSASFRPDSGRYWDQETSRSGISFFKLAVRLGIYCDASDAFNSLAEEFLQRRKPE